MKNGLKFLLLLCIFLVGCEVKPKKLSLEDDNVKMIIDEFKLDNNIMDEGLKEGVLFQESIYTNEKIDLNQMYIIGYDNAKNLVQEDKNCDKSKYSDESYIYNCKYIKYDDYNKEYNSLFEKTLPKENLKVGLYMFVYDSEDNIYRICSITAGGGDSVIDLTTIVSSEQKDDYIYIYEKVAFMYPIYDDSSNEIGYKIFYPKNMEKPKTVEHDTINKIKEKYYDTFETYKWTFKKVNNNYIYESLEYVKSN